MKAYGRRGRRGVRRPGVLWETKESLIVYKIVQHQTYQRASVTIRAT